jgi:flagellar hook-length control protein FliK
MSSGDTPIQAAQAQAVRAATQTQRQATSAAPAVTFGSTVQTLPAGPQDEDQGTGGLATVVASTAVGSAGTTATAEAPRQDMAAKAAVRVADAAMHRGSPAARPAPSAAATATPSQSVAATAAASTPATLPATQAGTPVVGTPSLATLTSASGLVVAALQPAAGIAVGASASGTAGVSPSAAPAAATPLGNTPATPDAMAASIVAMYRSGQSSLVLRLDPPGLGAVSVHLALGGNADVNVLFVPAVAQTAHLLQTSLPDLRQAMATSGLTLGQAQIGGGASGGGGGTSGSNSGTQSGTARRIATAAATPAELASSESTIRRARAIA